MCDCRHHVNGDRKLRVHRSHLRILCQYPIKCKSRVHGRANIARRVAHTTDNSIANKPIGSQLNEQPRQLLSARKFWHCSPQCRCSQKSQARSMPGDATTCGTNSRAHAAYRVCLTLLKDCAASWKSIRRGEAVAAIGSSNPAGPST